MSSRRTPLVRLVVLVLLLTALGSHRLSETASASPPTGPVECDNCGTNSPMTGPQVPMGPQPNSGANSNSNRPSGCSTLNIAGSSGSFVTCAPGSVTTNVNSAGSNPFNGNCQQVNSIAATPCGNSNSSCPSGTVPASSLGIALPGQCVPQQQSGSSSPQPCPPPPQLQPAGCIPSGGSNQNCPPGLSSLIPGCPQTSPASTPSQSLCPDGVTVVQVPLKCPSATLCPDGVTMVYPTNPSQGCPQGTACPDGVSMSYSGNPCPQGKKCDIGIAYATAKPPQDCTTCQGSGLTAYPPDKCPQGTLCLDMVTTIYPPKTPDDCPKGKLCPDQITTVYPTNPSQTCPAGTLCPDQVTTIYPTNPFQTCPTGTLCPDGATMIFPTSSSQSCPTGTKCWDGSTVYATANPPQTCPGGQPPTVNSVSCSPSDITVGTTPQSVVCTASVSAADGSPVARQLWTDTAPDAPPTPSLNINAGIGSPADSFAPTYNLTFSQPVKEDTSSVVTFSACADTSLSQIVSSLGSNCSPNVSTSITIHPPSGCRIDVRATHSGTASFGGLNNHLFIVHMDRSGNEFVFRGGPGGPSVLGSPSGTFSATASASGVIAGSIVAGSDRYRDADSVDWDPDAASVTVLTGDDACAKRSCLDNEVERITELRAGYSVTGPNSNTTVHTILHNCGLSEQLPPSVLFSDGVLAIGWNSPLLQSPP